MAITIIDDVRASTQVTCSAPLRILATGSTAKMLSTVTARESLDQLISIGGAGSWPPKASFVDTWPTSLRPYHHVYNSLAHLIPAEKSSLDDDENTTRIQHLRASLLSELQTNVDLAAVRETVNDPDCMRPSGWMGFFACMAHMRHAYRWGVSPVVRVAQHETSLDFPEHMDIPWFALQRRFDTTSPGGNLTSNIYYNFNERQELEYSFTVGLSETHGRSEHWNATLFEEMERRALPVYHLMVEAIESIGAENSAKTLLALKSANSHVKAIFKYFFDHLTDANVSKALWMAYVQGPHGWALGGIDGVSGGQSLVIRTLDSFLGIRPFPTPEIESLHLPRSERTWLETLRKYDIREVAKLSNYAEVEAELETMVKHLRIWRMGHMRRMVDYEGVPRPERQNMTAGKSLVATEIAPDENAMIIHLKKELTVRLMQTK
ncbi:hypothetical protein R3P38DRAFT_2846584 [Favolaschia claudopus]|uniref:Indoleamine 2,3-dioxygenase n=1 Tax=Favolaschia claudopus TaxID=2862362 RepID=A0AAW0DTX4_9AGAR